jgi:hypothetical protein
VTYVPRHERPVTWDICPEVRHLRRHRRKGLAIERDAPEATDCCKSSEAVTRRLAYKRSRLAPVAFTGRLSNE